MPFKKMRNRTRVWPSVPCPTQSNNKSRNRALAKTTDVLCKSCPIYTIKLMLSRSLSDCSTLLYSALLCSTLLYSALLCFTLLYSALLCFTLLYLLYSSLLCSTLLYSALLCFTLFYSVLLYFSLLYSVIL